MTRPSDAPAFRVLAIDLFERDVRLRLPFRFGVVTLTAAPQAFARVRVRLADGREAEGAAAEMMVPKWFDKDPALSNDDNVEQLRDSLRRARDDYLGHEARTAWRHASPVRGLVGNYGPALLDRALLDALCRARQVSFADAIRGNLIGAEQVEGMDLPGYLATLSFRDSIAARHTVGMVDALTDADLQASVDDGLPETLEQVIERYGHRWFKLKVSGDLAADLDRLERIAAVLDRMAAPYQASLDGNEQYDDIEGIGELWARMKASPSLARLAQSTRYIEQPVKRQNALERRVSGLDLPLIIDESDDALDAFPRARALGYRGVSSKTCKGLYKSLVNGARCAAWGGGYFMTGEDLTLQAGLALQQDLALVSLLGIDHVERNGHHYVNGMMGLPEAEQAAFLARHPDLYERSHGAVRPRIADGRLLLGSLEGPGFAGNTHPAWETMKIMQHTMEAHQ